MNTPQGQPPPFDILLPVLQEFCQVVATLRGPDGCPWDREQTLETIKPYTLEENKRLKEDQNLASMVRARYSTCFHCNAVRNIPVLVF